MAATPSQRVAKSRQKLTEAGGKRLPTVYLQPETAKALQTLLDAQYAPTVSGVVSQALLDAARKVARR